MKKVLMFAAILAVAAAPVFAQGAKGSDKPAKTEKSMAKSGAVTGVVSAVSADSVTVKGKDGADVMVGVDAKTNVQASGASHKTAAAKADNKPTPITDFVHVGDMVAVKYSDSGSAKTATSVRVTSAKTAAKK
ncbi:MAG TPA: hypothetical protein VGI12_15785 [Vicinamibacterales bacterium]|jgi:Flp pilus assembly protein TadD